MNTNENISDQETMVLGRPEISIQNPLDEVISLTMPPEWRAEETERINFNNTKLLKKFPLQTEASIY